MDNLKKAFKELLKNLSIEYLTGGSTPTQQIKALEPHISPTLDESLMACLPDGFAVVQDLKNTVVYKDGGFVCTFPAASVLEVAKRVLSNKKNHREIVNSNRYNPESRYSQELQGGFIRTAKEIGETDDLIKKTEADLKAYRNRRHALDLTLKNDLVEHGLKPDYVKGNAAT